MTTVIFYMDAMNFPQGNFIKKEGQADPVRSKMDGRDPSRVIHMKKINSNLLNFDTGYLFVSLLILCRLNSVYFCSRCDLYPNRDFYISSGAG